MLYILATGEALTRIIGHENDNKPAVLPDTLKNSASTIIPDAYFYFDCRRHSSKEVRINGYTLFEAVNSGCDIILTTPDANMIDKRVRNKAIILTLKQFNSNWEHLDKV